MAIPEAQLVTWSHQGSVAQSHATYEIIKDALEEVGSHYHGKDFKVFLQGSYGNDTNIRDVESDVDLVIRLDATFSHDLNDLSEPQRTAFHAHYSDAPYSYEDFKRDVLAHLRAKFGSNVKVGNKAIKIPPSGNRRAADVLVAIEHRRYRRFGGRYDQSYVPGIAFWTSAGNKIINFPEQHADNCTTKHQGTDQHFKPLVRIFKNARNKLITDGTIKDGLAPSYFIEGLLYNVPPEQFRGNYGRMFGASLDSVIHADRSEFLCANEQYYLLRHSAVTWPPDDCDQFLAAMVGLWRHWE
jgi:Nucleotidyltransferase domain